MKRIFYGFVALAGLAMVSCSQEIDEQITANTDNVKKVFTASTEDGADTRTSIEIDAEGNGTVIWNGEELIAVNGVDYKVTDGAGTKTVTFGANVEGTEAATAEVYNAIYPNNAWVEGGLNLEHLKEQSALNKTFGHGYAVTVATTTSSEMDLKFKNALSFLRVRFTLAEDAKEEAITIKTVKITAAEGDNLWGTVSSVDYATGEIGAVENGGNSILYNAGEDVVLSKGDVYDAVITLPVNNAGRTLTIEVTGENAWTGTPYIFSAEGVTKKYDRNRVTHLAHTITPEEVLYVAEGVIKDNEGIYRISSAEGLQWVATAVNEGRSFNNETLMLTQSIDLSVIENWTPIGTKDHTFQGTFDGAGYTISNLAINRPTESNVGLFGHAWTAKAIKNFTIENANVAGLNYTAVVLGNGVASDMSDITVKGNVIVEAGGSDIGVIAGSAYANMTNITINVSEASYLHAEGEAVGAIVGYKAEGTYTSSNLTSNIKVIGERSYVGGLFGIVNTGNTIENATCTGNVTLRAGIGSDGNPSLWRAYTVGGIIGSWVNDVTVNDCEFTGEIKSSFNGTPVEKEYFFHDGLVGFIWTVGDANILTIDGTTYTNHNVNSASVYDTVFASEANVACALVRGDYDLEANKKFTLENGKSVFMNMGGAAVSGTNTDVASTFSSLFTVKGNMTVVNGTVNYEHTGENMLFNKGTGAFNITAGGVVELNDVVVNTSGTDMNFGAHLNNWGTVTLIADNCEFNSTYCGVRVFNSGNDVNTVTITNSTLTGVTRAFWVQSNPDKTERLNIDIFDNNNTFTVTNTETALSGIRYGSNYLDEITGEVITPPTAVEKLNKQIAEGASTITLTEDVVFEEGETLTIPAGKTVTLDLAGYTMSQEMTCTTGHAMLCNHGTLTITGEGTMTFKDNGEGGGDTYATYVLDNRGTLTVENGTFTNLSEQLGHTNYAINASHSSQLITINDGIISAPYARSVRVNYGALVVNGGDFTGQVWGQPSAEGTSITITGGSFAPVYEYDGSSVYLWNSEKDVTLSITGGNFATKVGCNDTTKAGVVGAIKGGTFTEAAMTSGATAALVAESEGYFAINKGNGTYIVQKLEASEWGIVGGFNSWANDVTMYKTSTDNLFVAYGVEIKEVSGQTNGFKIRKNGAWGDSGNYGTLTTVNGSTKKVDTAIGVYTDGGSGNITVAYGTYDIYFDRLNSRVYVMTVGKEIADATQQTTTTKYSFAGSVSGWDDSTPMVYAGDGIWTINRTFKANEEWKVKNHGNWDASWGYDNVWPDNSLVSNSGGNAKTKAAGNYIVGFVASKNKITFVKQ